MSFPERSATPRDDRTGHERHREPAWCLCGRAVTVRGKCARCLHGLCRGIFGAAAQCMNRATLGSHCDACNDVIGGMGTSGT